MSVRPTDRVEFSDVTAPWKREPVWG